MKRKTISAIVGFIFGYFLALLLSFFYSQTLFNEGSWSIYGILFAAVGVLLSEVVESKVARVMIGFIVFGVIGVGAFFIYAMSQALKHFTI